MSFKKISNLSLFFVFICLMSGNSFEIFSQTSESIECTVTGNVLDKTDAVIQGMIINYRSSAFDKTVISDDDGFYKVTIPKGLYEISIRTKLNPELYKRANLEVNCKNNLTINIYPLPHRISFGDTSPEHKFKVFSGLWSSGKNFDTIFSFLSNRKFRNAVYYSDAMMTYDKYTLSANKISQDFENHTIKAEGNVWLEDGESRAKYENLSLKF